MKTTLFVSLAAALLAPAFANAATFISFDLGSTTEEALWSGFNSDTYTAEDGYPTGYRSMSDSWTQPISASGTNFSAQLDVVSGNHWISNESDNYIYNFESATYSITSSDLISDLETIVLQLESTDAFTGVTLSYNGGNQLTAADFIDSYSGSYTSADPMTRDDVASQISVYQWDLSNIGETINSIEIMFTTGQHALLYGASLSEGDTYSAIAVPEPSTYAALAGLAILGFVMLRRRKLSQK